MLEQKNIQHCFLFLLCFFFNQLLFSGAALNSFRGNMYIHVMNKISAIPMCTLDSISCFFCFHISREAFLCPIFASSVLCVLYPGHSIKFPIAGIDLGNKANVEASCAFGEVCLLTGRESEHTERRGSLLSCLSAGKLLLSMHRLKYMYITCIL